MSDTHTSAEPPPPKGPYEESRYDSLPVRPTLGSPFWLVSWLRLPNPPPSCWKFLDRRSVPLRGKSSLDVAVTMAIVLHELRKQLGSKVAIVRTIRKKDSRYGVRLETKSDTNAEVYVELLVSGTDGLVTAEIFPYVRSGRSRIKRLFPLVWGPLAYFTVLHDSRWIQMRREGGSDWLFFVVCIAFLPFVPWGLEVLQNGFRRGTLDFGSISKAEALAITVQNAIIESTNYRTVAVEPVGEQQPSTPRRPYDI